MSDITRDYSFGGWLRSFRIEKQIGLREMSRTLDIDASAYCKIEKSELSPPNSKEKLEKLVKPLELDKSRFDMLISLAYQHHLSKLQSRFK